MSKADLGAGDVEFTLQGEKLVLKPSLKACRALTSGPGGAYGDGSISDRLSRYDIDAFITVIRLGLDLGPQAVRDLDERIWREGMVNLIGPVGEYLQIVALHGGTRPTVTEDAKGKAGPQETGSAQGTTTES